jgi:rhodanese-related sulfurtransferase
MTPGRWDVTRAGHAATALLMCLAGWTGGLGAQTVPVRLVAPETLEAYLASHSGPILDVRMAGDCTSQYALRRRHILIEFDSTMADSVGREMAEASFLSMVAAKPALAKAKRADRTILVICCGGVRAEAAAGLLARQGYKTAFVPGGLQHAAVQKRLLRQ